MYVQVFCVAALDTAVMITFEYGQPERRPVGLFRRCAPFPEERKRHIKGFASLSRFGQVGMGVLAGIVDVPMEIGHLV